MKWRRRQEPEPPQNVKIHWPDGRTLAVECRYVGRVKGMHVWEVVAPVAMPLESFSVTVGVIPARTTIQFPPMFGRP